MRSIRIFELSDSELTELHVELQSREFFPQFAVVAGAAVLAYAVVGVWLWVAGVQDVALVVNFAVLVNLYCQVAGISC